MDSHQRNTPHGHQVSLWGQEIVNSQLQNLQGPSSSTSSLPFPAIYPPQTLQLPHPSSTLQPYNANTGSMTRHHSNREAPNFAGPSFQHHTVHTTPITASSVLTPHSTVLGSTPTNRDEGITTTSTHSRPTTAFVRCLMCNVRVRETAIRQHLASQHVDYNCHQCSSCEFKSTDESEAAGHARQTKHRVVLYEEVSGDGASLTK